jgi:hypothetical protein
MKWDESIPTQNATDLVVIKILEENILARFGSDKNFGRKHPSKIWLS